MSGTTSSSPHRLTNPRELMPASGFAHVVEAAPGRTLYIAGQTGHTAAGGLAGPSLLEQADQALRNIATALRAAGAAPEHLVSMQIFVTDAEVYRSQLRSIGEAWRRHLGPHYPAVSLFEVAGLFDPHASIEIVSTAVVPDGTSIG